MARGARICKYSGHNCKYGINFFSERALSYKGLWLLSIEECPEFLPHLHGYVHFIAFANEPHNSDPAHLAYTLHSYPVKVSRQYAMHITLEVFCRLIVIRENI